jgi:tripartite-type tricarboxylate transporter receptor subunit TctC
MLKGAAADSDFKDAMHKKGILITYKGAKDYTDHFQATYDKWLPIAKKVGVYKRK